MSDLRLDLLVKEKLNISRQKAVELIKLSNIKVNGSVINKPSYKVNDNDEITVLSTDNVLKYVSRGGYKLEKAIEKFNINIKGKVCIDIGSSTGGFTDCMLQYGAEKVLSFDVGSNQLADKIRYNSKVEVYENTDIRSVEYNNIADFISCDVSFISIKLIINKASELLKANGEAVFLIKPQFEAGREFINKNGIVKNPKVHKRVINDIIACAASVGLNMKNISFSPITGGDGNIEYILYVTKDKIVNNINTDDVVKEAYNNLK